MAYQKARPHLTRRESARLTNHRIVCIHTKIVHAHLYVCGAAGSASTECILAALRRLENWCNLLRIPSYVRIKYLRQIYVRWIFAAAHFIVLAFILGSSSVVSIFSTALPSAHLCARSQFNIFKTVYICIFCCGCALLPPVLRIEFRKDVKVHSHGYDRWHLAFPTKHRLERSMVSFASNISCCSDNDSSDDQKSCKFSNYTFLGFVAFSLLFGEY